MSVSVPRRSESLVSARKRAEIGASAAESLEQGARKVALSSALESALADARTDLSAFCTFAAGNLDWAAKPLLEAIGQGAHGPVRTRAWIMRNGAQLQRGARGFAVSAWGGYAFPLTAATKPFGGYGPMTGLVPSDELEGFEALTGDPVAALILCAMRGYSLPRVECSVTVDSLNRSLALARGIAWQTTCLGCDGEACLLCSCQDDANRQPLLDYLPVEESPKRKPGRPAKLVSASDAVEIRSAFEAVARLEAELDQARACQLETLKRVHDTGASMRSIAEAAGISHQRVHQIIQKGQP